MAISFDNSGQYSSGATSVTSEAVTFTVGSLINGAIIVYLFQGGTNSDLTPTCTYSGTSSSITRIAFDGTGSYTGSVYMFLILNPQSGSQTATCTWTTPVTYSGITATSYSGVAQVTSVDSYATTNSTSTLVTSFSGSTSVVASNSWLVWGVGNGNGATMSGGSGTTIRSATINFQAIADSNGTVGTGSQSLTVTTTVGARYGGIIASIAPYIAPAVNSNFFMFM